MKKVNVSFEGVKDTTGYLFTLVKCLSAVLRSGGYEEYAEDVIAASGFAFRTWAAADLCPSATSVWEFKKQKPWAENCGLVCDYTERMWGEDAAEKERREKAIEMIRKSVDSGVGAVAWDISGCEWGIVTGYDDESQTLYTLKTDWSEDSIPYEKLGQLEIPILSVLTVVGKEDKDKGKIVEDTKSLIAAHLRGEEWCDENTQGLAAYDTVIAFRTCPHRIMCTSFRQILPMTALKILDIRQYAGGFSPCPRQNLLENPHTYPMWTGSYKGQAGSRQCVEFRILFGNLCCAEILWLEVL